MSKTLKLALPAGSLKEATIKLLAMAGWRVGSSRRSYFPTIDDAEIEPMLIRPQEMPRYIETGAIDAGICGRDWVVENGSDIVEVAALQYSKATSNPVQWVLAVPESSDITSPKQLEGKRVATEAVGIVKKYFDSMGVNVDVEFSWGATEAKVPKFVDAIVDITETGSSLRANNLKIIDTILESVTVLVASKEAWEDEFKRAKIETLAMMLSGAIVGRDMVGLKMNLRRDDLPKILDGLLALRKPTISSLADEEWVAIETVMNETDVRKLIPELKAVGAEGIIEFPLNKVIH